MILDSQKNYQELDMHGVARSLELLPDQIRQVLGDARLIKIPKEYSQVKQVVVCGMGGSSLGAYIARSAFLTEIKLPITIVSGYLLPAHVNKDTLVVLSSYSGTTEETLFSYQEAKKRKAKIIAITAEGPGNKLKELMMKNDIPGYIFRADFNPCLQPRMAVGYAVFGLAVMLAKAGLFKIDVKAMEKIIVDLELGSRQFCTTEKTALNPAKKIALALFGKAPILVGAEHLAGNLQAMRNQINENAKLFAAYLELPDLNHFAMEGLANPPANKDYLHFLFFDSVLYGARVQKRFHLTKEVVKKNKVKCSEYAFKSQTRAGQAFEMLQLGSWVSYYLGILYGVDPVKIPWVDWFKGQLK